MPLIINKVIESSTSAMTNQWLNEWTECFIHWHHGFGLFVTFVSFLSFLPTNKFIHLSIFVSSWLTFYLFISKQGVIEEGGVLLLLDQRQSQLAVLSIPKLLFHSVLYLCCLQYLLSLNNELGVFHWSQDTWTWIVFVFGKYCVTDIGMVWYW